MTRLVFIDTETQGLHPGRRAWEVALIVRENGDESEQHWFIRSEDLDLGNADPFALKIGRFYERHPDYGVTEEHAHPEEYVLRKVELWTRGAHLIGAVPNFDADVLGTRMRAHGILPSWHYHLVDVEPLAAGWIAAHAAVMEHGGDAERARQLREIASPPWNSDELSRAVGVEPDEDARHTALGDAKFAMAIHDAVTGGAR